MTNPPPGPRQWWLRPAVALPVLAVVIALAAMFTPQQQDARGGDPRLSTYSTEPQGASLLRELGQRLGWVAVRHLDPEPPVDSISIIALLAPPLVPTAVQAHALLEHVRGGGALLYVMTRYGALNDSLGVARGPGAVATVSSEIRGAVSPACARENNGAMPLWPGQDMHLWGIRWRRPPPADTVSFGVVQSTRTIRPADSERRMVTETRSAASGFTLGRGRVVVIADPDLLRNDVLRVCRWGADVAAVRMLEFLDPTGTRRVVFDEFRQGHGNHPGTFRAIGLFFARTEAGRLLGHLILAGLVLLIARAPRLVPPRDTGRTERRSPAEHVQALARAYEKVGATRTAVLRMLFGLRRRVARHGAPAVTHDGGGDAFLEWVQRRAPDTAEDVATIRRALGAPVTPRGLLHAGEAIRRIEESLTTTPARRTVRPGHPSPTHAPTTLS